MLLIKNARVATMTGPQAAPGDGPLGFVDDGAVGCDGDRIVYVGPSAGAPAAGQVIDAEGQLLAPGLVDPHTHLMFAGDRAHEHAQRLAGASYLEIAQKGGGILSTVRATRAASDEELIRGARRRVDRLAASGVTTVEVKTGYGLTIRDELRILYNLRNLAAQSAADVVPTLLGLHAVPPEMDRASWVAKVANELVPEAVRLGARGCDAFLEQGAFDAQECRSVLKAGIRAGLIGHLHADQLTAGRGAQLAAELGCASAGHLEQTDDEGRAAMARSGTVAVLLPLAALFLRQKAASARPFLESGVTVALGSNLNPGSQPIESVSLLLAAGCLLSELTPAQALWACTAGGARALRLADRGMLETGLRADLVLFAARDPDHLAWHAGIEHARLVIAKGKIISQTDAPID